MYVYANTGMWFHTHVSLICVPRAFGHNSTLLSNAAVMFVSRELDVTSICLVIDKVRRFKRHIRIILWYSSSNEVTL